MAGLFKLAFIAASCSTFAVPARVDALLERPLSGRFFDSLLDVTCCSTVDSLDVVKGAARRPDRFELGEVEGLLG